MSDSVRFRQVCNNVVEVVVLEAQYRLTVSNMKCKNSDLMMTSMLKSPQNTSRMSKSDMRQGVMYQRLCKHGK